MSNQRERERKIIGCKKKTAHSNSHEMIFGYETDDLIIWINK